MFHLDYLSCILTILSTILVGRKLWWGLLIAAVNSLIVCVIGIRTGSLGLFRRTCFALLFMRSASGPGSGIVPPSQCRSTRERDSLALLQARILLPLFGDVDGVVEPEGQQCLRRQHDLLIAGHGATRSSRASAGQCTDGRALAATREAAH